MIVNLPVDCMIALSDRAVINTLSVVNRLNDYSRLHAFFLSTADSCRDRCQIELDGLCHLQMNISYQINVNFESHK